MAKRQKILRLVPTHMKKYTTPFIAKNILNHRRRMTCYTQVPGHPHELVPISSQCAHDDVPAYLTHKKFRAEIQFVT